jgi:hypothetical protein
MDVSGVAQFVLQAVPSSNLGSASQQRPSAEQRAMRWTTAFVFKRTLSPATEGLHTDGQSYSYLFMIDRKGIYIGD